MRNSGLYRQPGRFLGYIEGSPSIKYKSHHFTKYRVIGKHRVRKRDREREGGSERSWGGGAGCEKTQEALE
jgi:hypothetical protein